MKTMKHILKAILPLRVQKIGQTMLAKRHLKKLYKYDFMRFYQNASNMVTDMDEEHLKARITMEYHAIEKGFCKPNFRFGFGKTVIQSLGKHLLEYKTKGYCMEDKRPKTAIGVIEKYCEIHKDKPEYNSLPKSILDKLNESAPEYGVGVAYYQRDEIIKYTGRDYRSLATNRVSVRDYGEETVDSKLIEDALQIAMKTPSVCNRQTWMAHWVTDDELITKSLGIQGGFSGNGTNMHSIILVTTNVKCFSGSNERNQGYIDGGIYLMSLVYALTYEGLATCVLNAEFDFERERQLRVLLNIEDSEMLIGFITIGTYPEKFKSPVSVRDSYDRHLMIH